MGDVLTQSAHIYTSVRGTRSTIAVVPIHMPGNIRRHEDLLELRHSYLSHHRTISTR